MKKLMIAAAVAAMAIGAEASATTSLWRFNRMPSNGYAAGSEKHAGIDTSSACYLFYGDSASFGEAYESWEASIGSTYYDSVGKAFEAFCGSAYASGFELAKNSEGEILTSTSGQLQLTDSTTSVSPKIEGRGLSITQDLTGKTSWFTAIVLEEGLQGTDEGGILVTGNHTSSSGEPFHWGIASSDSMYAPSSGGWIAVTVPEPTSGLLVLLGVAAMALKRKRA